MFGVFLRESKTFRGSRTCLGSFCEKLRHLEGHENVWGLFARRWGISRVKEMFGVFLRGGKACGRSRKCSGSFCERVRHSEGHENVRGLSTSRRTIIIFGINDLVALRNRDLL